MIRRHLRELAEGGRVLCSRGFWRAFAAYWSVPAVLARIDAWAERR